MAQGNDRSQKIAFIKLIFYVTQDTIFSKMDSRKLKSAVERLINGCLYDE